MKKINNKIEESHCSIQVSKLLKEKGFDVSCYHKYMDLEEENKYFGILEKHKSPYCNGDKKENQHSQSFLAPTHAIAIEWIRVNFGICILMDIDFSRSYYYNYVVKSPNLLFFNVGIHRGYNTPQEATEAALLYTLTDLIK